MEEIVCLFSDDHFSQCSFRISLSLPVQHRSSIGLLQLLLAFAILEQEEGPCGFKPFTDRTISRGLFSRLRATTGFSRSEWLYWSRPFGPSLWGKPSLIGIPPVMPVEIDHPCHHEKVCIQLFFCAVPCSLGIHNVSLLYYIAVAIV
jgi:hypothetical protein